MTGVFPLLDRLDNGATASEILSYYVAPTVNITGRVSWGPSEKKLGHRLRTSFVNPTYDVITAAVNYQLVHQKRGEAMRFMNVMDGRKEFTSFTGQTSSSTEGWTTTYKRLADSLQAARPNLAPTIIARAVNIQRRDQTKLAARQWLDQ